MKTTYVSNKNGVRKGSIFTDILIVIAMLVVLGLLGPFVWSIIAATVMYLVALGGAVVGLLFGPVGLLMLVVFVLCGLWGVLFDK